MDPIEFLRAIRRRWAIVIAALAVALVPAWLTSAGGPIPLAAQASSYKATVVLFQTTSAGPSTGAADLETAAALTTVGEVPVRVAKALNYRGRPVDLAAQVTAKANTKERMIKIESESRDPAKAERVADAFARTLITFLNERRQASAADQIDSLTKRMSGLKAAIKTDDGRIAALPVESREAELLRAERDAKVRQYGFFYESYQRLTLSPPQGEGLEIIQTAAARPVVAGGFQAPRTQGSRLLLAGAIGLVLGVGIALLLERVDRRIHTREAAESGFSLPVLAEVPLGRGLRRASPSFGMASADAFRLLAAGVVGSATNGARNGAGERGPRKKTPKTILVTSAGPDEGKSVVVANLARTFAEQGKRVLVLSCDLRRPTVHRFFDVSDEGGLVEALTSPNGQGILADRVRETEDGRVRVVPSTPSSPSQAGELLSSENMRQALEEARHYADVVLLDTAPLLFGDAAHLVPEVDAVLVVARAGRTTLEMAGRTRELLDRLGAPTVGLALTGTGAAALPRRYYGRPWWRRA